MSTLKVAAIQDASGGNTATINTYTPTESNMGGKNRIINGDMRIDQRNAGAAVTSSGAYGVDRFKVVERSGYSTLSVNAQQSTDVPSTFINSTKITIATGEAVSASGYLLSVDQRIEGFNVSDLGFGTAAAKSFTLSFWVKSSLTGTYPVSFFNSGASRGYIGTYTINAANTWEYKTITVAGDTSGTWNTGNDVGIGVQFAIAAGSNQNGTAGSWSGTYKRGVSGMPDVGATTNNTFFITGVQLEVGSVATPFERRPYGTELMMCQRYYSRLSAASSNTYTAFGSCVYTASGSANGFVKFPNTMRASPTISYGGNVSFGRGITLVNITGVGTVYSGPDSALWQPSGLTGGADKDAGVIMANDSATAFVAFSAEL